MIIVINLHCPPSAPHLCQACIADLLENYGLRKTFHAHGKHRDIGMAYFPNWAQTGLVCGYCTAGTTINYGDTWEIFPALELAALQTSLDIVSNDTDMMTLDDFIAVAWKVYRGIYGLEIPSRTAAGEDLF